MRKKRTWTVGGEHQFDSNGIQNLQTKSAKLVIPDEVTVNYYE